MSFRTSLLMLTVVGTAIGQAGGAWAQTQTTPSTLPGTTAAGIGKSTTTAPPPATVMPYQSGSSPAYTSSTPGRPVSPGYTSNSPMVAPNSVGSSNCTTTAPAGSTTVPAGTTATSAGGCP